MTALAELARSLFEQESEGLWVEEPASFDTFVESPEHLNLPPLYARQRAFVREILGDDPAGMFDDPFEAHANTSRVYQLAVGLWGKGCLLGHMRLADETGARVPIAELAAREKALSVVALDQAANELKNTGASAPWIEGTGVAYRVVLSTGRYVDVYEGHQFLSRSQVAGKWINGWMQLRDLEVGSPIAVPTRTGCHGTIHAPHEARWIGYVLGDGSAGATDSLPRLKAHSDEAQDVRDTIYAVSGRAPTEWPDRTMTWFGSGFTPWETRRGENPLYELAKRIGILGLTSYGKHVPEECFTYDEPSTWALLSGLWQTDGWVCANGPTRRTWEAGYGTVSETLARDIQDLLQRVGVVAKLTAKRTTRNRQPHLSWQLKVHHRSHVLRLLHGLHLAGAKGRSSDDAIAALTALPSHGPGIRDDGPVVWDKIAAIEPLGVQPYYDLEVPVHANYAAEGVLHHNSGKDYVCSIIVCYCIHVLLCLRDPQGYLELAPGEAIDIINVAYNAEQAKRVFFTKLKARLEAWPWLRARYNIVIAGRRQNGHRTELGTVQVNDDMVEFPGHIRAWSRHAQNESYEGLNVLVWLMDEASAFLSKLKRENASSIYQTLKTSAGSRFGRRWVGMVISYPRHADDFTMTLLNLAHTRPELGIYGDGPAMTWEVNERTRNEPRVQVRHIEVPASLAQDFEEDFEEALGRYCCEPPKAREAFFRYPQHLWEAVTDREAAIEWEPTIIPRERGDGSQRKLRGVRITKTSELPSGTKLYVHGDPGLSNDSYALALGYAVPATIMVTVPAGEVLNQAQLTARKLDAVDPIEWERDVTRTIIIALIVWRPDPRQGIQVDLQNVEDTIFELRRVYPSIGHWPKKRRLEAKPRPTLTTDHWNAAQAIQRMEGKRLNVKDEMWSRDFQVDIYRNARTSFYQGLVDLPNTDSIVSKDPRSPGALYELERVEFIDGQKIDHPANGGSKDMGDAIVRVIQHATEHNKDAMGFGTTYGHVSAYSQGAPMLAGERKPIDPNATESIGDRLRLQEEQARRERPLGELVPSEGTVDGRKMGFGSIGQRPGRL